MLGFIGLLALLTGAEAAPAGSCFLPATVGVSGRLVMRSGTQLEGKVLELSEREVLVRTSRFETARVRRSAVLGAIPAECLDPELPYRALAGATGRQVRIVTVDGRALQGRLEESPTELTLDTPAGRLAVARENAIAIVDLREEPRPIDLSSRHLEAPSAIPVPSGTLHLSVTQGIHLAADWGLTRWLEASAGGLVPALHGSEFGASGLVGVRGSLGLGAHVHLAAGIHARFDQQGGSAGYLSATATWSSPVGSVTLHAGPTFPGLAAMGPPGDLGAALAATANVRRNLAVVAEGWWTFEEAGWLATGALRYRRGRLSMDVGLSIDGPSRSLGPWLGVTLEAAR